MRTATIRTRVALVAAALALTALLALGYQQLSSMSATFTRVAEDQSRTLTTQLSNATSGAGAAVVDVIPYTDRGLDGVVLFDAQGRPTAGSGGASPQLRALGAQARSVARSRRPLQQFRLPQSDGSAPTQLRPWSPDGTVQVTIVPHDGGALAAVFHVDWATSQMRTRLLGTSMSLVGGALFIAFGLMLTVGRLVTRPLGRLASEVRGLGNGEDAEALSDQSSPELQRLASDVWQMHEDLTNALKESSTDPLTGIANHRAFQERLESAVGAAQRSGEPLALIAFDLDYLKQINDGCGHLAGDRVIAAVARELTAACGDRDLCARVGGDEFAIVGPGRDAADAAALAGRVAAAVGILSLERLTGTPSPNGIEPSVSFGVAALGAEVTTKDALIEAADAALYRTKFGARAEGGAGRGATPAITARLDDVVGALALAVDAKDSGTHSHCETVADLAVAIGRLLRFDESELESLRRAALLHDVGKIGTPDAVLLKPGRLDDDEFRVMKQHPTLGYRIVRSAGLPDREASWVLHHHEHLDGSGYPHGLRGDEIPLQARIILVADAFEAMTSDRPYRRARPAAEAIEELRRCAGRQFDPAVVEVIATVLAQRAGGPEVTAEQVTAGGAGR